MKKRKALLYDPYLDVLGGGEKHILSILKVLSEYEHDIDLIWESDIGQSIREKLDINIEHLQFIGGWKKMTTLQRYLISRNYDHLFCVTDGSYFASAAKHNHIFSMVPQKSLYQMNIVNRIKLSNWDFISNSRFTHDWLAKWNIMSEVIEPYIESESIANVKKNNKKLQILSVGRFFPHLHSKKQELLITWFKEFTAIHQDMHLKLILAGSIQPQDASYLEELRRLSDGREDIIFKVNVSHDELNQLYRNSLIYWHAAGYGVDAGHPEQTEHFGITPLEAMSHGCIVFCHASGGPSTYIIDAKNGFLYNKNIELYSKMDRILLNEQLQRSICTEGLQTVHEQFSYKVFRNNVTHVLRLV